MPVLTQGNSVDLTITADSTICIQNPGGVATVQNPVGTTIYIGGAGNTNLDVRSGTARITATTGSLYYEFFADAQSGLTLAEQVATRALVSGAWDSPIPSDYPVHSARVAGPLIQLDLPSPYFPATADTKEHAYGTPLYSESGFGGYHWWMMAAPYPTLATNLGGVLAFKFENPTIYVTNDPEGITGWTRVPGAASPLFDSRTQTENSGNSYYADPHLSVSADGKTMYCLFHWFNRVNGSTRSSVMLSSSTDGLTWTTPVSIYNSTTTTFTPNSCSLICNGAGLGFTVVGVDTRDGTGTFTLQRMTTASSDPTTGWGAWTTATAVNPNSRNWWHMHCVGLRGGVIVGMAVDNGSGGGQAYTMRSDDNGLTWSCEPFSYINLGSGNGSWYRPSLALVATGRAVEARLYVTRINPMQQNGFWVQTAKLATDGPQVAATRASQRDMVARKVTAAELKRGLLAWDSFVGADVNPLVTLDSGHAWASPGAAPWQRLTNKAQTTTTTNQLLIVDVGRTSYELEVRMDTFGTQFQLVWGYVDAGNFFRFGSSGIQRIAGGLPAATYVNPASLAYSAYASGTWFQMIKQGPYHTMLIDDRVVDTFYDAAFPGATKVGVQASGAVATALTGFLVRNVL